MKLFNKIAIIGTGLIGGSIAGAIKKQRLAKEVIGVSRSKKTLALARKIHLIDRGSQDIHIIKDADLVVLATPVNTVLSLAPIVSKIIRPDCVVTDVASSKNEVVSKLDNFFPFYVGGHPLAGSEKRGVINASAGLFQGSLCILTPTGNTDRRALNKMKLFWSALGARVIFLNPHTHDKILTFVSHLPHTVAFCLIDIIPKQYLKFASTGLRDTTRIAASDSVLWADIFLSNAKNMLQAIELFKANLSRLKSAIQKKDRAVLTRILEEAKKKRDSLI